MKPINILLRDLVFFRISITRLYFSIEDRKKYSRPEENSIIVKMQFQVILLSVKSFSKLISIRCIKSRLLKLG